MPAQVGLDYINRVKGRKAINSLPLWVLFQAPASFLPWLPPTLDYKLKEEANFFFPQVGFDQRFIPTASELGQAEKIEGGLGVGLLFWLHINFIAFDAMIHPCFDYLCS